MVYTIIYIIKTTIFLIHKYCGFFFNKICRLQISIFVYVCVYMCVEPKKTFILITLVSEKGKGITFIFSLIRFVHVGCSTKHGYQICVRRKIQILINGVYPYCMLSNHQIFGYVKN